VVPADEDHPDCVFIEDTAVIVGEIAVITRPGAPSRRGETGPVAAALLDRFQTVETTSPATLDGGDAFTLGDTLYVGRSSRTNEEGVNQLGTVALEQGLKTVTVGVEGVLHLKSAVLPIDRDTVVVTPGTVAEDKLHGLDILYEDPGERHRFSALPLGEGTVLVTAAAPVTAEMVSGRGHVVRMIDVSEIQAADGGLTCMSILF
jgi:dimethylargininase